MNKSRVITFHGTLDEIQKQFNEWSEKYDNIEIVESVYLQVRETGSTRKSKTDFSETEHYESETHYALAVNYIETDEMHIKRVNKGTGTGVL